MVRKAQRGNLPDDHYLKQGAKVPSAADMAQMRAMGAEARWAHWKEHHGQHCWAMHFEPGGCQRVRCRLFELPPLLFP